ncbi:MAG: hypothetical protein ICV82_07180, partial [Nitrososphaera sp.]|nr:hypothetical protein [Nitrososphaera sp.]
MRLLLLYFLVLFFFSSNSQNTYFYGRITGRLPYLEYGLGDDRLGGAKMTYLDTGILSKVVDSTKDDYKVQLSANHFAYLPKQSFKPDTSVIVQPYYLTSSWQVWGDEKYDYVSVTLPERLPYRSQQQVCPARIALDIFGVTSNTNWITQLKTVKEIPSTTVFPSCF